MKDNKAKIPWERTLCCSPLVREKWMAWLKNGHSISSQRERALMGLALWGMDDSPFQPIQTAFQALTPVSVNDLLAPIGSGVPRYKNKQYLRSKDSCFLRNILELAFCGGKEGAEWISAFGQQALKDCQSEGFDGLDLPQLIPWRVLGLVGVQNLMDYARSLDQPDHFLNSLDCEDRSIEEAFLAFPRGISLKSTTFEERLTLAEALGWDPNRESARTLDKNILWACIRGLRSEECLAIALKMGADPSGLFKVKGSDTDYELLKKPEVSLKEALKQIICVFDNIEPFESILNAWDEAAELAALTPSASPTKRRPKL